MTTNPDIGLKLGDGHSYALVFVLDEGPSG